MNSIYNVHNISIDTYIHVSYIDCYYDPSEIPLRAPLCRLVREGGDDLPNQSPPRPVDGLPLIWALMGPPCLGPNEPP